VRRKKRGISSLLAFDHVGDVGVLNGPDEFASVVAFCV
jgi:hypothetical protein